MENRRETLRPNGHAPSFNPALAGVQNIQTAQSQAQTGRAAQRGPGRDESQEVKSVILKVESDLIVYGLEEALKTGALEPNEEVLQAIQEHARASARAAYRETYDPNLHHHDRLSDEEYKKLLRDRELTELAEMHALAALGDSEREVARTPAGTAPREPSPILTVSAVVAVMITVAPTLHDFVFITGDDIMSWTLSMLCGLFLGLMVTLMILSDVDQSGQRSAYNWIGIGAGIFMCLALCAIRLKGAATTGDYIFAFGLSGIEAAIVLALEGVAMSRRSAQRNYQEKQAALNQTTRLRDAALAHLERIRERLTEIGDRIRGHIGYVEDRSTRNLHINEIEAAAVKAASAGYLSGISENRGRVLGIGGTEQ